jgi:hypothetical protein
MVILYNLIKPALLFVIHIIIQIHGIILVMSAVINVLTVMGHILLHALPVFHPSTTLKILLVDIV